MFSWAKGLFGKSNTDKYPSVNVGAEYRPSLDDYRNAQKNLNKSQHQCPTCNVLQKMLDEDRARLIDLENKFLRHLGVRSGNEYDPLVRDNDNQSTLSYQRLRADQAKQRFKDVDNKNYNEMRQAAEKAAQELNGSSL